MKKTHVSDAYSAFVDPGFSAQYNAVQRETITQAAADGCQFSMDEGGFMAARSNRRRDNVVVARVAEDAVEWLLRAALLAAVFAAVVGGAGALNGGF
jgi:hypothetical protein